MIESHDSQDPHDESSDQSPIRAKDEQPTEAHGGNESEQAGGAGAGPEGLDREDTHKQADREDGE